MRKGGKICGDGQLKWKKDALLCSIGTMNLDEIISQLQQERARIDQALTALQGGRQAPTSGKRRGRPPGSKNAATSNPPATATRSAPKKRAISAEARRKMADAAKK